MSSAGYQLAVLLLLRLGLAIALANACFHSGSGMVPWLRRARCRSFAPNPSSCRGLLETEPALLVAVVPRLPEVVAGRVEVRVAGTSDRTLQLEAPDRGVGPVVLEPRWSLPSFTEPLSVIGSSGPRIPHSFMANDADELEGRARRVLALRDPVRPAGDPGCRSVSTFGLADAADELTRVVVGCSRHRDDRAVGHVRARPLRRPVPSGSRSACP